MAWSWTTVWSDDFQSGTLSEYASVQYCRETGGLLESYGTAQEAFEGTIVYSITPAATAAVRVSFDTDRSARSGYNATYGGPLAYIHGNPYQSDTALGITDGRTADKTIIYWGSNYDAGNSATGALPSGSMVRVVMTVWFSTMSGSGESWTPNADGRLLVTVDGSTVVDASNISICTIEAESTGVNQLGGVTVGPMGQADDLLIEVGEWVADGDWEYDGITAIRVNPTSPVGYLSECGADPNSGEDLCGKSPRVWAEWSPDGAALERYAMVRLNDDTSYYGGHKPPRLVTVDDIRRALSSGEGEYEVGNFRITVIDATRDIRTWLTGTGKYWRNKPLLIRAASDATRAAHQPPYLLAYGSLSEGPTIGNDLSISFACSDFIGSNVGWTMDTQLPKRTVRPADLSGCPSDVQGTAVPIGYGWLCGVGSPDRPAMSTPVVTTVAGGSLTVGKQYALCVAPVIGAREQSPASEHVFGGVNGASPVPPAPTNLRLVNISNPHNYPLATWSNGQPRPYYYYVAAAVQTNQISPLCGPLEVWGVPDLWEHMGEADTYVEIAWDGDHSQYSYVIYGRDGNGTWLDTEAPWNPANCTHRDTGDLVKALPPDNNEFPAGGGGGQTIRLTWTAFPGATSYNVYFADAEKDATWVRRINTANLTVDIATEADGVNANRTSLPIGLPADRPEYAGDAQARYVGDEVLGGVTWRRLLLFGHAVESIDHWYFKLGSSDSNEYEVQSGTNSNTSFESSVTGDTEGMWIGSVVTFTSGSNNGESRTVSGYNATTKVLTVNPGFTNTPADNDTFTMTSAQRDQGAGIDFLVPGYAGWSNYFNTPYRDILSADGNTYRYTMVYVTGTKGDMIKNGDASFAVDCHGIEDVGNGSGDCITDVYQISKHFLNYWVIGNYRSGNWGLPPVYPDTQVCQVNSPSFCALTTLRRGQIDGGYVGSVIIGNHGETSSVSEILKWMLVSGEFRIGPNKNWQIVAQAIDEATSLTGVPHILDKYDVHRESLTIDIRVDEMANEYEYQWGDQHLSDWWIADPDSQKDATSITNWGLTEKKTVELKLIQDGYLGEHITRRKLNRTMNPPTYVKFEGNLCLTNIDLGSYITFDHYRGMGASGYVDQPLWVIGHTLVENGKRVQLECLDVSSILGA